MAMPSRKRLVKTILIIFLVIFFGAIVWYLLPLFFGTTVVNDDGTTERKLNLFPFGDSTTGGGGGLLDIFDGNNSDGGNGSNNGGDTGAEREIPRLRKISEGPVITAHLYPSEKNVDPFGEEALEQNLSEEQTENLIRFVMLGTGHVFDGSTNHLDTTRVSNTTIPKIHEAFFVNPERLLIRYNDEFDVIKTFSAELVPDFAETSGVSKKLQGIFLEDNILDMTISPEGKVFYLRPNNSSGDVVSGVISDAIGENRTQVFSSPLSEWRVGWQGRERQIMLTSTPSYNTFGISYLLDVQTGSFSPFTPGRLALQSLGNQDLSAVLLSMNTDGAPKLYIWKKQTNQYIDLNLSSYAEKCVWANKRAKFYCAVPLNVLQTTEPDLWYQGVSQNIDEIWEIDPVTGQSSLIVVPISYTTNDLDMIDMDITDDERFLYFRNKNDRSLWSYDLEDDFANENQQTETVEGEEEFFE